MFLQARVVNDTLENYRLDLVDLLRSTCFYVKKKELISQVEVDLYTRMLSTFTIFAR